MYDDGIKIKFSESENLEKCKEINKAKKILKDLTHDYVYLYELDVLLIDTPYFQRLKDIRQLTSQHVYANARHTRFEHSLGVMELTRQAIKYINQNGYLPGDKSGDIINPIMKFHASLAALLHDIGHCPFSHLGESQFIMEDGIDDLRKMLLKLVKGMKFGSEELCVGIQKHTSIHELLSCIIIIKVYRTYYNNYSKRMDLPDVDWGFIIRCILGITFGDQKKYKIENILINLINSDTLDMDKLDYIMRDSLYTGISAPKIDTKRLFNNMFVSEKLNKIIYTSGAVPVLQTIIETRDNLYLYVYNHHTVVYTDFLYSYLFRRLLSNYAKFGNKLEDYSPTNDKALASMPNSWLFSWRAIRYRLVSDCTLRSLLIETYNKLKKIYRFNSNKMDFIIPDGNEDEKKKHEQNIRVLRLLDQLIRRQFLKPWWKKVFEYKNFMESKFTNDAIRKEIEFRICRRFKNIEPSEFRSEVAKAVIFRTNDYVGKEEVFYRPLVDGEFFIVERSNKFYTLNTLKNIMVYIKGNEIIKPTKDFEVKDGDYFGKFITSLLPQKDYDDFFDKESFYLYLLPYERYVLPNKKTDNEDNKRKYYKLIEDAFINVAEEFAIMTEQEFKEHTRG
jgi:HD superfamily phosphohydrolase